jgi:hypothetical protein
MLTGGLLFQTSCKSKSTPSQRRSQSTEAKAVKAHLKELLEFAIVGEQKPLPKTIPGSTTQVTYTNDIKPESRITTTNNTTTFTLLKRTPDAEIEISFHLEGENSSSEDEPHTLTLTIPKGDDVVEHYAKKLLDERKLTVKGTELSKDKNSRTQVDKKASLDKKFETDIKPTPQLTIKDWPNGALTNDDITLALKLTETEGSNTQEFISQARHWYLKLESSSSSNHLEKLREKANSRNRSDAYDEYGNIKNPLQKKPQEQPLTPAQQRMRDHLRQIDEEDEEEDDWGDDD